MEDVSITAFIEAVAKQKNISKEIVLEALKQALSAAYRKDFGEKNQNIKIEFDPETGKMDAFDVKTVVADLPEEVEKKNKEDQEGKDKTDEEEIKRFNSRKEITISEAKKTKKKVKIGDELKIKLPAPDNFGRVAAQTAKQVIVQRLREAERLMLFQEYKQQEKQIVEGTIQRLEQRGVVVGLEKAIALLPFSEQVREERYNPGAKMKFYLMSVNQSTRGPEIILSRRHPAIIKALFAKEIPEISEDTLKIKSVAREAGSRVKVAVSTEQENLDPIGACIGQRGVRIQTIISELSGEKVDIVKWSEQPKEFITNALSPAKIGSITLNEKEKKAIVEVANDQLSLAIGRNGQNARLASRLTGWEINIKEAKESSDKKEDKKENKKEKEKSKKENKEEDKKEDKKTSKKKDKTDKKIVKMKSKTIRKSKKKSDVSEKKPAPAKSDIGTMAGEAKKSKKESEPKSIDDKITGKK